MQIFNVVSSAKARTPCWYVILGVYWSTSFTLESHNLQTIHEVTNVTSILTRISYQELFLSCLHYRGLARSHLRFYSIMFSLPTRIPLVPFLAKIESLLNGVYIQKIHTYKKLDRRKQILKYECLTAWSELRSSWSSCLSFLVQVVPSHSDQNSYMLKLFFFLLRWPKMVKRSHEVSRCHSYNFLRTVSYKE